ncbi:PH domain-containing protein [Streptosporangium sp. NPDC000396]|uniref:PH domain-containing protein n=1 Tax=Streptosporangium sp. NPDC000396 TaxID=3366185 RepID=UPI0036A5BE6A
MFPASFHPRPSRGYLSLYAATAILGFAAAVHLADGGTARFVIGIALTMVTAYLLALALCFPLMRYTVSRTTLSAEYGPMLRFRVPLDDIAKVSRVELAPSFLSALVMPGIALYGVRYLGLGRVRMCATRVMHDVFLVETKSGARYGITPADEHAFVHTLRRHGVRVEKA